MHSVKDMNPVELSSAALNFSTEVGINQVGESDKVGNSNSGQYFIEIILYVKCFQR